MYQDVDISMAEQQKRRKQPPGWTSDEKPDPYVAPRDEPGASDEIVMTGRIDYSTERIPTWPPADSSRQYIATPDEIQEIQHGVVTWIDAATSDKTSNEEIDRDHTKKHRKKDARQPRYEL